MPWVAGKTWKQIGGYSDDRVSDFSACPLQGCVETSNEVIHGVSKIVGAIASRLIAPNAKKISGCNFDCRQRFVDHPEKFADIQRLGEIGARARSEERRVGKRCV